MKLTLLALIIALHAIGSDIVYFQKSKITLADQWILEDVIEIGTIVVEEAGGMTVCLETQVGFGSGGDVKVMGPISCTDSTNMFLIDEAIKKTFQESYSP